MKPIFTLAVTSVASLMMLSLASVQAQTYPPPPTDVRSMEEIDMPQEMMGEEEMRHRGSCPRKCNRRGVACHRGCVANYHNCQDAAGKDKDKQEACRKTFDECKSGCRSSRKACRKHCKEGE